MSMWQNIKQRWQRDDPFILVAAIITVVFVMAFVIEVFL